MTGPGPEAALPRMEDLHAYLFLHGWQQIEGGRAASIWSRQSPERPEGVSLLVPHIEEASDYVDRVHMLLRELSKELKQPEEKVRQDAALVHFDVAPICASDDAAIDDSIPLQAGVELFAAARKMIVAAAGATERRASHFGRSLSGKAREHTHVVRVGQTQRGSYIVPIISRARYSLADAVPEQHLDLEVERSLYERRVMSTFASAVGTLEIIVRSGRSPKGHELTDAVNEGVSRELCLGVLVALKSDAISNLSIGFRWAPASTPPRNSPEIVEFPEQAKESLTEVAERLRTLDLPRSDVLYGVVTELKHRPNDPDRRVGVEALVGRRVRTVFMNLTPEQYEIAKACHERSKVFVRGELRAPVGDRAEMRVDYFGPDEALNLNLDDDAPSTMPTVRLPPKLIHPPQPPAIG